ncbi:uncharacterized protein LOC123299055 [Chrysoperla carnea]|uniref:uncharacterized protein LOC123299055 n=1 Tax=Chrysoperla carnea TaxID=189513 RepID=UPI001D092FEB|nr:uncharacterized protein LOC123299055 [Chrysoperla carnea]
MFSIVKKWTTFVFTVSLLVVHFQGSDSSAMNVEVERNLIEEPDQLLPSNEWKGRGSDNLAGILNEKLNDLEQNTEPVVEGAARGLIDVDVQAQVTEILDALSKVVQQLLG